MKEKKQHNVFQGAKTEWFWTWMHQVLMTNKKLNPNRAEGPLSWIRLEHQCLQAVSTSNFPLNLTYICRETEERCFSGRSNTAFRYQHQVGEVSSCYCFKFVENLLNALTHFINKWAAPSVRGLHHHFWCCFPPPANVSDSLLFWGEREEMITFGY